MKGQVPKSLVQELSLNRANSVKEAIVRKFPSLQPNQFSTAGIGWDRPADPSDPENHAKNRRVEDQGLPGGGDGGPQVDAARIDTVAAGASARAAPDDAPPRRRGGDGRRRAALVAGDDRRSAPRTG